MKDIEELPGLMVELLESVDCPNDDAAPKFPRRATEIVKEISEYAKDTKIYRESADARTFWADGTPPEEIYTFMLEKVVGAPTTIHRDAAVILHMPALEKALAAQRRCRVCGCTDYNGCACGCFWVEDDLCSACADKEEAQQ